MKNKEQVGKTVYEQVLHKEVEMSRLFLNTKIEQQSDLFMDMLDIVVKYLDEQPSTFNEKLQALSIQHANVFGVQKRHYKHFRQAFMKAIQTYLPWTERRQQAWMWFWNRVVNIMGSYPEANSLMQDLTRDKYLRYVSLIHITYDNMMNDDPLIFGEKFYRALVASQPDIANLFKETEVRKQGAKFISMLRHAIRLLDDEKTFGSKLSALSEHHVTYGVKLEHLNAFGEVLVEELKKVNGKLWDEEVDDAWLWFWHIVVNIFSEGLQRGQEKLKNHQLIVNNNYNYINNNDNNDNDDNNNNLDEQFQNINLQSRLGGSNHNYSINHNHLNNNNDEEDEDEDKDDNKDNFKMQVD